jgi:hypothetical protein
MYQGEYNMTKALAFLVAVGVVLSCISCFAVTAEKEPDTVYNLIPSDSVITYTAGNGYDATASFDGNGVLTVKADSGWPLASLAFPEPYTFPLEKATLKVKFELKNGGTSLRLGTPDSSSTGALNEIFIHHFIAGATFDTAGDLATPGVYEFEIPFTDLFYCDWTAAAAYQGKLEIPTDEISLSYIEIYSVNGAEVVIDKLQVVVEGDEIIDMSEETSGTLSEAVSEETSQEGTPETGNYGIIVLVAISVISLAGAIVVKRKL